MPRFFDDYSHTYLTHDSAAGRKQQRRGWKFRENFKAHVRMKEREKMFDDHGFYMMFCSKFVFVTRMNAGIYRYTCIYTLIQSIFCCISIHVCSDMYVPHYFFSISCWCHGWVYVYDDSPFLVEWYTLFYCFIFFSVIV
jgi:hypothetical protein